MSSLAQGHLGALTDLAKSVRRHTEYEFGIGPYPTAIRDIALLRTNQAGRPAHCLIKPALCMSFQGTKWATFGNKRYKYEAGQGLVVSVDLPSRGTVSAASPERPYLGLTLDLDFSIMQKVAEEIGLTVAASGKPKAHGAFILELDLQLLNCARHAIRLLETPEAIPVLYPGVLREVCYWLLKSPAGPQLIELMVVANAHDRNVVKAIHTLRNKLNKTTSVENLALTAHMSPATFHRHFKAITGMAPLQYQKQLRLHEARRLLIFSDVTLEAAAQEVGYASASQFSREYSRMFGNSPRREVSTWRRSAGMGAVGRLSRPQPGSHPPPSTNA